MEPGFKDLRDCNILFVSSSEKEHIESVIDAMKGLPILTIGDAPGFASAVASLISCWRTIRFVLR